MHARLGEIAKLRESLDDEERDILTAIKVVARFESRPKSAEAPTQEPGFFLSAPPPTKMTHRQAVIAALKAVVPPWVSSYAELQEIIKRDYGIDIPKTSILPLLSDLKGHGVIVRNGQEIALAERVMGARETSPGAINMNLNSVDQEDEKGAAEFRSAAPLSH